MTIEDPAGLLGEYPPFSPFCRPLTATAPGKNRILWSHNKIEESLGK